MDFPYSLLRPVTPSPISEELIPCVYWDSLLDPRTSEDLLRKNCLQHFPRNKPLSLWSLSDDDAPAGRYHKQNLTTVDLIILSIWGDQNKRLTFSQICEAIENRWPTLKSHKDKPWRSTIRHSLTRKAMFVRISRNTGDERSAGGYWTIDATRGSGDTRDRVRGGGGSRKISKSSSSESSNSLESDRSSISQFSSSDPTCEASLELHHPYNYNQSPSLSVHGFPASAKMAMYSPTQQSVNFPPSPAGHPSHDAPGRMGNVSQHEGGPDSKYYRKRPY